MVHVFFKDPYFNFEFVRVLATAPQHGCDVGEVIQLVHQIHNRDPETWFKAFDELARRTLSTAHELLDRPEPDVESAKWALLRASNYFRASEFMLHQQPEDVRISDNAALCAQAFKEWVELEGAAKVRKVSIPYEGIHLPGYFYMPQGNAHTRFGNKVPLMIVTNGWDSVQEELYFLAAEQAACHGFAVLTFDGPGQGQLVRQNPKSKLNPGQSVKIRPDWENVISPVIDFANKTLSEHFDSSRISLLGMSMGGYFSVRAASHEPRIRAVVSIDGFSDLLESVRSKLPSWFFNGWKNGYISDRLFNAIARFVGRLDFQSRWSFGHGCWAHGVDGPAALLRDMARFKLEPELVSENMSKQPCFVTGAKCSLYFPPNEHAQVIFKMLSQLSPQVKGKHTLWVSDQTEAGGHQARIGASSLLSQRLYPWLYTVFGSN